ncbi:hypothetical protein [Nonomuraea sp. NPDC049695]|uniref:hypothetical protein n=1 Tax=Nonomuraea sp. NPDC049695 TaxID=3154734 RepID=UPI0034323336
MNPADDGGEPGQDLARVWGILAHIVAPTTLVVAIMMYFGAVYTNNMYGRLGVDSSMLGLSVQDYVLRSVPVAIEPLVVVLLAALIVPSAHACLIRSCTRHRTATTWSLAAAAVLGAVAVGAGILSIAGRMTQLPPIFMPICLGLGIFVVAYSWSLYTRFNPRQTISPAGRMVQRTVCVALLLVLLLWAVTDYARQRGQERAYQYWAHSAMLPSTVVYAPRRLYLEGPGITETTLPDPNAMFRYRYTGLRLLIDSNRRYFLLPACWATSPEARAIALPADDSLRLEFFMISQAPDCP